MLQLDQPLLDALHGEGFEVAVETNGTLAVPNDVDWICVSLRPTQPWSSVLGMSSSSLYPQQEEERNRSVSQVSIFDIFSYSNGR